MWATQSWIKRPCLKLARFLRNLPRTKHLHMMGLLSDPSCAACGIEEESALHFICVCSTLTNLRTQIFVKTKLNVSKYEGMSPGSYVQFAEKSGKFENAEVVKTSPIHVGYHNLIYSHAGL
jgi:hypothetical protein